MVVGRPGTTVALSETSSASTWGVLTGEAHANAACTNNASALPSRSHRRCGITDSPFPSSHFFIGANIIPPAGRATELPGRERQWKPDQRPGFASRLGLLELTLQRIRSRVGLERRLAFARIPGSAGAPARRSRRYNRGPQAPPFAPTREGSIVIRGSARRFDDRRGT